MKKWHIIVAVCILVIGGLVYFFSAGEDGTSQTTAGTIQVSEEIKIKVVFVGPPEIRADWEKLGMEGFQLQLIGTLTNVSEQTIKFSEIAFVLDGQQLDHLPGGTLEPGEERKIAKGFPADYEDAKTLEVIINGFEKVGDSTITSTEPEPTNQTIFTSAPNNPRTPEETVAAFAFLSHERDYNKARELCTDNFVENYGLPEQAWNLISGGGVLKRIEITDTEIYADKAFISLIFFFENKPSRETIPTLLKQDGFWRLDQ